MPKARNSNRKSKKIHKKPNAKHNPLLLQTLQKVNEIIFPDHFPVPKFDQTEQEERKYSPKKNSGIFQVNSSNFQKPQIFTPAITKDNLPSVLKNEQEKEIDEKPTPYDDNFDTPQKQVNQNELRNSFLNSEIKELLRRDVLTKSPWLISNDNSLVSKKQQAKVLPLLNYKPSQFNNGNETEIPILPINKSCCNCQKSRCLKLYCDCFANQRICQTHCNCIECLNTKGSKRREKAIESTLRKNPQAFEAKLTAKKIICTNENNEQKQIYTINCTNQKSCNCRNSQCQKKYCDCFRLNLKCNALCKCEDCQNGKTEDQVVSQELDGFVVQQVNSVNIKEELINKLKEIKRIKFGLQSNLPNFGQVVFNQLNQYNQFQERSADLKYQFVFSIL